MKEFCRNWGKNGAALGQHARPRATEAVHEATRTVLGMKGVASAAERVLPSRVTPVSGTEA